MYEQRKQRQFQQGRLLSLFNGVNGEQNRKGSPATKFSPTSSFNGTSEVSNNTTCQKYAGPRLSSQLPSTKVFLSSNHQPATALSSTTRASLMPSSSDNMPVQRDLGTWANGPPRIFDERSYGHPATRRPSAPLLATSAEPTPTEQNSTHLDNGRLSLRPRNRQIHQSLTSSNTAGATEITSSEFELTDSTLAVQSDSQPQSKLEGLNEFTSVISTTLQDQPQKFCEEQPTPANDVHPQNPEVTRKSSTQVQDSLEADFIRTNSNEAAAHPCRLQPQADSADTKVFVTTEKSPRELDAIVQPQAKAREVRLSPQQYHQQSYRMPRSSWEPPSASRQASMTGESGQEQLRRAQDAACGVINDRLHKKNRNKTSTTNVPLLHAIRKSMPLEKEARIAENVRYYLRLGESPAAWPKALSAHIRSEAPDDPDLQTATSAAKNKEDTSSVKKSPKKRKNCGWATASEVAVQEAAMQAKWKTRRNKHFADSSEVRAERYEKDSNAYGSVAADDTPTESADSNEAINSGSVGRHKANGADPGLVTWDGKFMSPPIEWELRPRMRYSKITATSPNGRHHLNDIFHQQYPETFQAIPTKYVCDINFHADGISMGSRDWSINKENMTAYFGYDENTDFDQLKTFKPASDDDFDREGMSDNFRECVQNDIAYSETSEIYCQRYLAYNNRDMPLPISSIEVHDPTTVQEVAIKESIPDLSIYLRPATLADIDQVTAIYNYYVEHTPYPTDLEVIDDTDMRENLNDTIRHKLPFLVAVEKKRNKNKKKRLSIRAVSNIHPIQNTNPSYQPLMEEENIVGFAYTQDWTAHNFCERTSVEMELYVAPKYRILGVGACLMDRMVQICDAGYISKGGYDFTCLPEKLHLYSEGGGRDLHKMYVCVRTWSRPEKTPHVEAITKKSDREDECELWLKPWLEKWGFVQEGHLREIGARKGRYIDTLQFGRTTTWAPKEGEIPDPLPGST